MRTHLRLDAGWRFHVGETPSALHSDFDDSGWRKVDLPHDWSIEDLPTLKQHDAEYVSVVPGTWRFMLGDDPKWSDPNTDTSGWQEVTLPAHWSAHGVTEQNVYGWYRRKLEVPRRLRGKDVVLLLGKIDDVDETFVNGTRVGGTGAYPPEYATAWTEQRRYRIPEGLLRCDGTDTIAVRVYNGEADAGIYESGVRPLRSGPFDTDSVGGTAQGYTVSGVAWYRKTLRLPASQREQRVRLAFDGVYMDATVWVNGKALTSQHYGYAPFTIDITSALRWDGRPNVIAVRVDSSGKNSRWYSGSGIYRPVWLTVTFPVSVAHNGVRVTAPEVSAAESMVRIETGVVNEGGADQTVDLETRILTPGDREVASFRETATVLTGKTHSSDRSIAVREPALWSPETPSLYTVVSTVRVGGKVVDEIRTPFGIRTMSVDAKRGFLLNGKPLKLRGGCVHHDNGPLGSAAYDRAEERRVELLKASGFNAVRTAHNPPSTAFLEACDRLGMLVMDEFFDCWTIGKNPDDYARFFADDWRLDIAATIARDRNHPSVVMWSIGNEIPEQNRPEGARTSAELAAYVRWADPSRPVAVAAFNDVSRDLAIFPHVDVCGYNYMPANYDDDHTAHPDRVMAGTESFPWQTFEAWRSVLDKPYVLGDFVWTAFDYIGEAGLGHPVGSAMEDGRFYTLANCGDIDICGWKRPQSYYRDAVWGRGQAVSCFVEAPGPKSDFSSVSGFNWGWPDEQASWTWPGREGQSLKVRAYSFAPKVRLTRNGRTVGVRETSRATQYIAEWMVPYEPGELVATALRADGSVAGTWRLRTAGRPVRIDLAPDRTTLTADGHDLSYVTVELRDANGVLVPNADRLVRFKVTGPATIVAVGSADPKSVESFRQPKRQTWRGKCLVVIKCGRKAGEVRLAASAPGVAGAEAVLRVGR